MTARDDQGILRDAVVEFDADDVDVLDDMMVRHDVAARVDDDAGAHAVDAALRRRDAKLLGGRGRLHGAFAVDVDDGTADALDESDDRTPAGGELGDDLPRRLDGLALLLGRDRRPIGEKQGQGDRQQQQEAVRLHEVLGGVVRNP